MHTKQCSPRLLQPPLHQLFLLMTSLARRLMPMHTIACSSSSNNSRTHGQFQRSQCLQHQRQHQRQRRQSVHRYRRITAIGILASNTSSARRRPSISQLCLILCRASHFLQRIRKSPVRDFAFSRARAPFVQPPRALIRLLSQMLGKQKRKKSEVPPNTPYDGHVLFYVTTSVATLHDDCARLVVEYVRSSAIHAETPRGLRVIRSLDALTPPRTVKPVPSPGATSATASATATAVSVVPTAKEEEAIVEYSPTGVVFEDDRGKGYAVSLKLDGSGLKAQSQDGTRLTLDADSMKACWIGLLVPRRVLFASNVVSLDRQCIVVPLAVHLTDLPSSGHGTPRVSHITSTFYHRFVVEMFISKERFNIVFSTPLSEMVRTISYVERCCLGCVAHGTKVYIMTRRAFYVHDADLPQSPPVCYPISSQFGIYDIGGLCVKECDTPASPGGASTLELQHMALVRCYKAFTTRGTSEESDSCFLGFDLKVSEEETGAHIALCNSHMTCPCSPTSWCLLGPSLMAVRFNDGVVRLVGISKSPGTRVAKTFYASTIVSPVILNGVDPCTVSVPVSVHASTCDDVLASWITVHEDGSVYLWEMPDPSSIKPRSCCRVFRLASFSAPPLLPDQAYLFAR